MEGQRYLEKWRKSRLLLSAKGGYLMGTPFLVGPFFLFIPATSIVFILGAPIRGKLIFRGKGKFWPWLPDASWLLSRDERSYFL